MLENFNKWEDLVNVCKTLDSKKENIKINYDTESDSIQLLYTYTTIGIDTKTYTWETCTEFTKDGVVSVTIDNTFHSNLFDKINLDQMFKVICIITGNTLEK